ncbi:MAG: transcriptional repressor [Syntrophomonadaceae bacterium]|nr:transcriptional repressor [Syntrophomonadaceae bacterium]
MSSEIKGPETDNLSIQGLRLTKQRAAIMQAIHDMNSHFTAEDIYTTLKPDHPRLSLATVYRNLERLTQAGLITKLNFGEGKNRYEITGLEHHHHLVCLLCGKTVRITHCPLNCSQLDDLSKSDFRITGHQFEVYGYCKRCDSK